jgi:GcrA cell cycle regulator
MTDGPIPVWMRGNRIERARALWDEGLSTRLIAQRIGHGCTKSAIVGWAHRHNWPPRASPIIRGGVKPAAVVRVTEKPHHKPSPKPAPSELPSAVKARAARRAKRAAVKPSAPLRTACEPQGLAEPTAAFSRCQWPQGDRGDWRFCDAPTAANSPYCQEHKARAWVRRPSPREAWVSL